MCDYQSDPSMHDEAVAAVDDLFAAKRARCQETVATAAGPYGEIRLSCNQVVGVTTWKDETGVPHAACALHVEGMKRRWREPVTA